MEQINVEIFKNEYKKTISKMEEIGKLPNLNYDGGSDFESLYIEDNYFVYKTSSYYQGCGTDYFYLYVSFDEINNDIEYFREKFQKEMEAEKLKKEKKIEEEKEKRKQEEFKVYQKLKAKYDER